MVSVWPSNFKVRRKGSTDERLNKFENWPVGEGDPSNSETPASSQTPDSPKTAGTPNSCIYFTLCPVATGHRSPMVTSALLRYRVREHSASLV